MNFEIADLRIPGTLVRRVDRLPEIERSLIPAGRDWSAAPGIFLLNVPDVGAFLVRDGTQIDVAVLPGADERAVRIYLLGSVRAAVIHQRGELPLHAATLVPPGSNRAVAICGASGTGKSTLARELVNRGWRLIADDLTRIAFEGPMAMAWPSEPYIKLWMDDSLAAASGLERVRIGVNKFFVPVPVAGPAPLAAVIAIIAGGDANLIPLSGLSKRALVTTNTAKPRQVVPLGCAAGHIETVARIVEQVDVFQLLGGQHSTPTELAVAIEATVGIN